MRRGGPGAPSIKQNGHPAVASITLFAIPGHSHTATLTSRAASSPDTSAGLAASSSKRHHVRPGGRALESQTTQTMVLPSDPAWGGILHPLSNFFSGCCAVKAVRARFMNSARLRRVARYCRSESMVLWRTICLTGRNSAYVDIGRETRH